MNADGQATYAAHTAHAITPACPVDCLRTVISGMAFNALARAYQAPFDPPATVAEVVRLCQQRKLHQITGLGPRREGEIQGGLVYAGLDISTSEPAP